MKDLFEMMRPLVMVKRNAPAPVFVATAKLTKKDAAFSGTWINYQGVIYNHEDFANTTTVQLPGTVVMLAPSPRIANTSLLSGVPLAD